jgi:hypothetical protein
MDLHEKEEMSPDEKKYAAKGELNQGNYLTDAKKKKKGV